MKTKVCSQCKFPKAVTEFNKTKKHKDGLRYTYRECDRASDLSVEGLVFKIYRKQVEKSRHRGHPPLGYTKYDLLKWCISESSFNILYSYWVMSDYHTKIRPSVDRICNAAGYSFDNIQLMTWRENNEKSHFKKGCNTYEHHYKN